MTGIVLELQKEALESDSDILSLLRKSYTIAKKLKLNEFERWVHNELNGYTDMPNESIPIYRKVHGEIKAWNPMNGWIPVLIKESIVENTLTEQNLLCSISDIIDLYESKESPFFCLEFNAYTNNLLSNICDFNSKYQLHASKSQLKNIIETVKTTILDWTIKLESNGIIGNGLSFNAEEIEKAQSPSVNTFINFFNGNASNIQMQQDTSDSEQSH